MKFNRTGYFLLVFFGGMGTLFFVLGLTVPSIGFVMVPIGGIWMLVTLGLILYARQQGKKAEHDRWLFENGLAGTATVVDTSSNTRINDQPVVKFQLDVEVPGQAPRRIQHKILMSDFAAYRMRPGVVLPVHVNPDPRKPGDLLVRW